MHIEIMGSFIIYAYLGIFRRTEHIHWQVVVLITTILFCAYPFYACFFIGYIIAELHKKYNIHTSMQKIGVNKNKVEIIVILSFVALAILSTHFRANDYVICLLGAGIVIFASLSNIMKTFFANRVSTFLGKISFPLYLIHVPVICSWSSYLYLKLPECGVGLLAAGLINFFSTVLFCLILATLLTPIEKISVKYSKKIAEMLLYFPLRKTSQFANLGYSSELQK